MFDAHAQPLVFPAEGIRADDLLFRLPTADDAPTLGPAFQDPDIGGRANMPPTFDEATIQRLMPMLEERMEKGDFLPLLVINAESEEILGGGNLHAINRELGQAEIGYWLLHHARGRGIATRTARFLAGHAFSLGLERVEARVFVGNPESERVLERAGFTREGVLRSLPHRSGGRADMVLFSLLPGE